MDKELKVTLRLRGDTKENLQAANIVLKNSEPCVENDGGVFKLKIGDGTTTYNNLPYYMVSAETQAIDSLVCKDGVVTINSQGKVYSFDAIAKDANGRQIDTTYLKIEEIAEKIPKPIATGTAFPSTFAGQMFIKKVEA